MVRVYIIMHNLEDASAEWLVREETSSCLLESFRERYPAVLNNLPNLCFKEQYNPNDETLAYHPFAYVADVAHPIDLSMDLDAVQLIVERSTSKSSEASMMQLRDAVLASDSKMAWYIVNCGDERREYDDSDTDTTKNDIDLEQKEDSQTHSVQATPRVMQTIMISKISGTPSSPMTIDSNCRSRNNNLVGRPRTSSSSMTSGSQDAVSLSISCAVTKLIITRGEISVVPRCLRRASVVRKH